MLFLSRKGAERPKITFVLAGLTSLVLILLVALPTIFPGSIPVLKPLAIDTDPENMLESDEPARVFHNRMKREFALYDMVVVGVINTDHPQGVFNVQTLRNVYELADHAGKLQWEKDGSSEGVIAVDLIAPSTVDNIEQAGPGTVRFEWLMPAPPATEAEALAVARKARRIPFLDDTLISRDGKALALYIPITSKDVSYEVASDLRKKIDSFSGKEQYHITGLPVAQDQFGLEMFKQMAISAPMAMLLIFGLMWLFFRHVRFIVSPMIVAMVAVIDTMGLLVVAGNTIHIMSSMIPIFIMPIAVLDSVHILSEFFDLYPRYKDRAKTLKVVMEDLNTPMLFTSLTTGVGFASLALTPIPPVQVFGIFVGIGVVLAWFLTITLVPAYIMMMPESSLEGFGSTHEIEDEQTESLMSRFLVKTGNFSFNRVKLIFIAVLLLGSVAVYGITRIQINDNPVKWFNSSHEIRVADRELNKRFGGTYMAYLTLSPGEDEKDPAVEFSTIKQKLADLPQPARASLLQVLDSSALEDIKDKKAFIASLTETALDAQDATDDDAAWDAWDEALLTLGAIAQEGEIFKRPEVLGYIERLEESLQQTGLVGKSNSLPDIVKTVHRELLLGKEEEYRIPNTPAAVAQTLITYQNSHRPQDLWHFVTPDYRRTNLWLQLKSGDNIDMNAVVNAVDRFFTEQPPPVPLNYDWFGLTYINVVWQQKMVSGMMKAFLSSFLIVLAMMIFLFRSFWWGLLSMVPLTVTIVVIYGIIGLIGKDYDMPVAILSSLSLGLAVDYAIHFLARSRAMRKDYTTWKKTVTAVFGEPARSISRNVIVIGVGFMPLLAAPLMPYKTVGVFISAILLLAGAATLILLPALLTFFEKPLFRGLMPIESATLELSPQKEEGEEQ